MNLCSIALCWGLVWWGFWFLGWFGLCLWVSSGLIGSRVSWTCRHFLDFNRDLFSGVGARGYFGLFSTFLCFLGIFEVLAIVANFYQFYAARLLYPCWDKSILNTFYIYILYHFEFLKETTSIEWTFFPTKIEFRNKIKDDILRDLLVLYILRYC